MSALLEDGDHLGLLVRMFPAGEIAFRATIYQGQHGRIVDLARWDRVNAKLVDRVLHQRGRPHQKDKSPLAGILYCRTRISYATDLDQPLIKAASTSQGPRGKRTQLCVIISLIVQATRVANRSLSYPC